METEKALSSKARLAERDIHEQWENDYLNADMDRFYDEAFARIVGELGDTRGKSLLDVGCGYCFHTRRLARSELVITAVDFSQAALDTAAETLAGAGLADRVTLRQADARQLPFADASFDHVVIWGVLMHIPDIEAALGEAARVLRPGGRLVLTETNRASIDVMMIDPLINAVKRLIGRKPHQRQRGKLGLEEWQDAPSGSLLVRKTDMRALTAFCDGLGLRLVKRFAGHFTEQYIRLPTKTLKRLIHWLNLAYFRHIGSPRLAVGNILVFEKR